MWTNMLLMFTITSLSLGVTFFQHDPTSHVTGTWFLASIPIIVFLSLLIFAPLGGLFGLVTSRQLTRRIRELAQATMLIAQGDYHLHVPIQRKDEVGILEEQFNIMAHQLAESRQREQDLLAKNVRLEERARISRELHDTISQNLFSLRLLAEGIQTTLPENSPIQAKLALFGRTTDTMTREMRALLLELRPVQLEALGLKDALKELATIYCTRLDLAIVTEITEIFLPEQMEHALFRVAQEAVSNAVRHAQATHILLQLLREEESVILSIQDNGSGFDPASEKTYHGVGLQSMQERIHQLNGTLHIQSAYQKGTCIIVTIPQKENNP